MKDKMDEYLFVASGFLMAVSLAIFVFYVVWQNIYADRLILRRLGAMMEAGDDSLKYLEIKGKCDEEAREWHRRTFRSWHTALVLTIGPAAISVLILFYAFIIVLLQPVPWGVLWYTIVGWFS